METSSGESTPKRHSRHGSSGRGNLPRRSTRGPLDVGESPLTPTIDPLSTTNPTLLHQPSSLLSPTTSQYMTPRTHTPRLPSPNPGSNLSTLSSQPSFRTAQTTQTPISRDFSFLLRPEIYHPLTLLEIPPPFRSLSSQPLPSTPLHTLVSSGHFRSAAILSASLLTTPGSISPTDHAQIFSLIYTRLSSLTLCNQTSLAAQEVKALEDLNSAYYRDEESGTHLVHWELRLLAVRLQGMGFNDARRGVMGFYDLASEARLILTGLKKSKREAEAGENEDEKDGEEERLEEEIQVWEERLVELGVRVASALVEMEDLEGATRFLNNLKPTTSFRLQMQKALLCLCLGDVEAARLCIGGGSRVDDGQEGGDEETKKVILALAYMADSEFENAVGVWEDLVSSPTCEKGEKAMYQQNLGVSLLYLGRMSEAREILESLIAEGNSFHALTFNLSTIYELCTERSRALKIGLAEKVAGMMEDDGEGERRVGWEKVNGDFKL